jgi:hypothetical protein
MASKAKQLRKKTSLEATDQPAINQLTLLSKEQQQNPITVLEEFFSNYHLQDIRECLWDWLEAALASENGTYQTGKARGSLLFLYKNIETLTEAAFILHRNKVDSQMPPQK